MDAYGLSDTFTAILQGNDAATELAVRTGSIGVFELALVFFCLVYSGLMLWKGFRCRCPRCVELRGKVNKLGKD